MIGSGDAGRDLPQQHIERRGLGGGPGEERHENAQKAESGRHEAWRHRRSGRCRVAELPGSPDRIPHPGASASLAFTRTPSFQEDEARNDPVTRSAVIRHEADGPDEHLANLYALAAVYH